MLKPKQHHSLLFSHLLVLKNFSDKSDDTKDLNSWSRTAKGKSMWHSETGPGNKYLCWGCVMNGLWRQAWKPQAGQHRWQILYKYNRDRKRTETCRARRKAEGVDGKYRDLEEGHMESQFEPRQQMSLVNLKPVFRICCWSGQLRLFSSIVSSGNRLRGQPLCLIMSFLEKEMTQREYE